MQPLVSIVLGSYNRKILLKSTIDHARKEVLSIPHEIIVVDGGSSDGTLKWLSKQKDVITIIQHNHGFWKNKPISRKSWGYFMNLGFKCAQAKYILMISDDCLLDPNSVMNGYNFFEDLLDTGRKIGALAFYWRNWPEQDNYWVGLTLGGKMFVNHGLFLKSALEDVGWIDEDHYHFYHADGDLSLKLWQKGYEVVDCPQSFVEHFIHFNIKLRKNNMSEQQIDWQTYIDRWNGIYYDPKNPVVGSWIHTNPSTPFRVSSYFPKRYVYLIKLRKAFHFIKRSFFLI
jgi:glycosyltransferase involved in cell wall biosynthesis